MRATVAMLVLGLVLTPALSGCEREQGAFEKAGEKLDEAVDEITHPNEGPLEKAERKTEEALESVKEKLE